MVFYKLRDFKVYEFNSLQVQRGQLAANSFPKYRGLDLRRDDKT